MPPPKKIHVLAQEDFDCLLLWLDPDREQAGLTYEKIRWRLITIFAARGCSVPEELADETIDRVARRTADIAATYTGDKALYFFGVATNVHHEYLKRPAATAVPEDSAGSEPDQERMHWCLEHCLERFPDADRGMLLRYYSLSKQAKIDLHRQMAGELNISINTLRLRVLRMKDKLQPCIERCLSHTEVF